VNSHAILKQTPAPQDNTAFSFIQIPLEILLSACKKILICILFPCNKYVHQTHRSCCFWQEHWNSFPNAFSWLQSCTVPSTLWLLGWSFQEADLTMLKNCPVSPFPYKTTFMACIQHLSQSSPNLLLPRGVPITHRYKSYYPSRLGTLKTPALSFFIHSSLSA
jgi:hypothetical protein